MAVQRDIKRTMNQTEGNVFTMEKYMKINLKVNNAEVINTKLSKQEELQIDHKNLHLFLYNLIVAENIFKRSYLLLL